MQLTNDLISQFVKITKDTAPAKKETTVYGTVTSYDKNSGIAKVVIAGSETETPAYSAVSLKEKDKVIVVIKNHTATVMGSTGTSDDKGSASNQSDIRDVSSSVSKVERIVADQVTVTDTLTTKVADVEKLKADKAEVVKMEARIADVETLKADKAEVEELRADIAEMGALTVDELDARYASIDRLDTTDANVADLSANYAEFKEATTDNFEAMNAEIESLDATYVNIDFSNIDKAWMEEFYAKSGIIEFITAEDGTYTGHLVGVTISGDLIEGNTIVADKLVVKGEDGLYYKLNTDGVTTEAEQTDYNSLNGQAIKAKSVTAEKISVSDLVAFDATIGGFSITDDAIFSEVKDSEGNTTRGIYMDSDGQLSIGDETNYIKYYQDTDGSYKLIISAASILYALNGKQYSIADLGHIGEYVHIGTYEDEPCIELGEADSDFKLIITNTKILFMEGASVPAYINNQSLHITKAVIEEEIQQGEFVWRVRQNGNMGLMWKGDI